MQTYPRRGVNFLQIWLGPIPIITCPHTISLSLFSHFRLPHLPQIQLGSQDSAESGQGLSMGCR